MEGASEYVGYSKKAGDRELSSIKDLESALGKTDDILGPIPTADEMAAEIEAIKEDVQEAAEAVSREGIKDDYAATEPPRELKEPE